MDQNQKKKQFFTLLIFCVSIGLIATLWGYNYSAGNAEEQLPFIFRAMDPTYLANDFFTNTFMQYGPRTIYSEFIALLARVISLPVVLFSLTFIANAAIALLSALTAQFFFKGSKFSGFLAAAGVMTLKTFWLGYSNILYRNFLEPAQLAVPLLLLGFYLLLHKRYILSAIPFGVAAFFHPLLGLETGWLLFGVSILMFVIQCFRKEIRLNQGTTIFIGAVVLAVFSVGLFLPYALQKSIPAADFINIVAYVRHPHHYLPSTFETWQYTQAALYLAAFGLFFWNALKESEKLRQQRSYLILTGGLIAFLCLGGTLFVEVWPSRIWTSAQMFRLPYLIKWFSLVLMTGWVGYRVENAVEPETRFQALAAGISLIAPVSMLFFALTVWIRQVVLPRVKLPRWLFSAPLVLAVTLGLAVVSKPDLRTWFLFLLCFGLIWIGSMGQRKFPGALIASAVALTLTATFVYFGFRQNAPGFLQTDTPVFSLYAASGEIADVAAYAKANTPANAIFLTPPKFGEFRYMADRAIVVDFVAFAFQDEAMLEWNTRLADCYGTTPVLGFNKIPELNRQYRETSDEKLIAIAQKYNADYIIVFNSAKTQLPILFQTKSYKLVKIPEA